MIEKNAKKAVGNGCKYYKKCGACQLQNLTYPEQLKYKQAKVIKLVGKFCHVEKIIGMEHPYHYRHKVQAAFGYNKNGVVSGIYQSSTHKLIQVNGCMIENETADRIIQSIKMLCNKYKLKSFDDRNMTGFLRHTLVRCGYYSKQYMVVLITAKIEFPSKKQFISDLIFLHPEITTIVQNINNKFTSMVLGEKNITLFGNGYIIDSLCGYDFKISPNSFYQVNPQMTEILYDTAIGYLQLNGNQTVVDAYCGTGTIGLIASKSAKEVIGVELNSDAIKDAKTNAKLNNVANINFINADATDFLSECDKENIKIDALILDPPRAGSTSKFINSVCNIGPKKVVYVSCNPETLSRDLYAFCKKGYKVKKIQPVDMFPHTNHVETVVLLSKLG